MSELERGIDKFVPGQLVMLKFSDLMNMDPNSNRFAIVPAIILAKTIGSDGWPVYEVGFWTKNRTGGLSGMLVLQDICVWRYMTELHGVPEGIPPKWFLDSLKKASNEEDYLDEDYGILYSELFWINEENNKVLVLSTETVKESKSEDDPFKIDLEKIDKLFDRTRSLLDSAQNFINKI